MTSAIDEAFKTCLADKSFVALPITLVDDILTPAAPICLKSMGSSFQNTLNQLDDTLDSRTPIYLLLRRNDSIVAITYVPYLAKEPQRLFFLQNRDRFVQQLGEDHFSSALICKEIGEITDVRSWIERDEHEKLLTAKGGVLESGVKDVGYKQNKCRLCDRRMKNPIDDDAIDALKRLESSGAMVQMVSATFDAELMLPLILLSLLISRPTP